MNYGLDIEKELSDRSDADWVFGAAGEQRLCATADMPSGSRSKFMPRGEVQRGAEDTMDCATRAPINIVEAKLNWLFSMGRLPDSHVKWLMDNGFMSADGTGFEVSDAFIAIKSGTTRRGNSLIAPAHALHECGIVPKSAMPLLPDMSFDEYHDKGRITAAIEAIGKQSKEYFKINYERIPRSAFSAALAIDMIDTGGYAWDEPVNGVYGYSAGDPNHAFVVYDKPDFQVFDNYIDPSDGDFFKNLSTEYAFIDSGYRILITIAEHRPSVVERLRSILKWLFRL